MPLKAALAVCALLVAAASVMTFYSLALAADGSFQLLRALATGDVFGANSRILGAVVREGAVVAAARAGVTDTHLLSMLLGVGQLVVPAIVWSLAILLTRADRLVCAAVSMCAGLSAGTLWLMSVCEIITAASLTVLVAVLLWRPCSWRWRHAALAIAASSLLVASYETALVTGAILGGLGCVARDPLTYPSRASRVRKRGRAVDPLRARGGREPRCRPESHAFPVRRVLRAVSRSLAVLRRSRRRSCW